jgi:hypothetical protein
MLYRCFLLTGIILLFSSLYHLKQSIDFVKRSEKTIGTVIEMVAVSGDGGATYTPIFTLRTKNNQQITYRHSVSSAPPSWKIGQQATFLYDPANPHSARMVGYFWIFNWTIIFMVAALPLIIIGGGYCLVRSRLGLPQEA